MKKDSVPRLKLTGKIILQAAKSSELKLEDVLRFEQWMNGKVAAKSFKKFGIGMRVHVTGEPVDFLKAIAGILKKGIAKKGKSNVSR